jgi:hypothetical protein
MHKVQADQKVKQNKIWMDEHNTVTYTHINDC